MTHRSAIRVRTYLSAKSGDPDAVPRHTIETHLGRIDHHFASGYVSLQVNGTEFLGRYISYLHVICCWEDILRCAIDCVDHGSGSVVLLDATKIELRMRRLSRARWRLTRKWRDYPKGDRTVECDGAELARVLARGAMVCAGAIAIDSRSWGPSRELDMPEFLRSTARLIEYSLQQR